MNEQFIKRRRWLPPDLRVKRNRLAVIGGGGGGGDAGGLITPASAPSIITPVSMSEYETQALKLLKDSNYDLDILRLISVIGRTITPRTYTIGTSAVQIIKATDPKGYIILNPSRTAGFTTSGVILADASYAGLATGNTQATSIGVANYDRAMLYLTIPATSAGATVKIDIMTQDNVSGAWATAQADIFGSPTAAGTYYANIGNIGVDTALAIKYTIGAAGAEFSLNYTLKDGLPGSAAGVNKTVYLGNQGVSSVSGFDLLEGQKFEKFFLANAELWAVSGVTAGVTIKVFEMS